MGLRQTNTGADDCSATISLGIGYNGPAPLVQNPDTRCAHYDLDGFLGEVSHCDVVLRADEAAVVNMTKHLSYGAWQDHAEGCVLDD